MQFEEQIEKVRKGDHQALNDLLCYWRKVLRKRSSGTLGRDISARADTSDVAQEAIIQTWRDLPQFRGNKEEQFFAWTRAIGNGQAAKQSHGKASYWCGAPIPSRGGRVPLL